MQMRVVPWFTDGAVCFLNNLFKWYHDFIGSKVKVLEFGGGNSTLYFLSKNCRVLTVESDEKFVNNLYDLVISNGKTVKIIDGVDGLGEFISNTDLLILKASDVSDVDDKVFDLKWDIIVNDGVSRKEVVSLIENKFSESVIILDNIEYCANWGRLARSSAKVETVEVYRRFIRSNNYQKYLFEQPEGREGYAQSDCSGWESPNRWITGIFWSNSHIFSRMMLTHQGSPVVNIQGVNDDDLLSLEERCPYDWNNKKWILDEYPKSLDLKLDRRYV
jgi:hypothetical protein